MRDFAEQGKSLGKIVLTMYGITAALLFLLAVLMQNLQLKSGMVSAGITITYVIACFLGGFLNGKIRKQKKFLWGLLVGLLYVLIMLVISVIVKERPGMNLSGFLSTLFICIGSGMLGGMVS